MESIYILLFFIIGIVMGSFYNVVGFRLSQDLSIVKPKHSYCPNCKHELKPVDLVPIFSFIFLKGKCRYCNKKISAFYPLIEFFTGILFAVSFYSFSFSFELIIALLLVSLFSIVIVSDLNFYIIPDQVTLVIGILIFIVNIFSLGIIGALEQLLYGFAMFAFMYFVGFIGNFLFKQEALGGGDIKLLFVLGMTLPFIISFCGIILSTFLALPVSLYLLIKHKDKIVPFGPFLVSAFLILYMFKIDVNTIYKLFELI